jgi:hypothetical protein
MSFRRVSLVEVHSYDVVRRSTEVVHVYLIVRRRAMTKSRVRDDRQSVEFVTDANLHVKQARVIGSRREAEDPLDHATLLFPL